MMKAILCLAILVWSISNVLAQPMVVEWEREIRFENDSLIGFSTLSLVEDQSDNSMFLAGITRHNSWESNDSSDAILVKLDGDGDSIWTILFDSPDLHYFTRCKLLSNGNLAIGSHWRPIYYLNTEGAIVDSVNHDFCDGRFLTDTERMATTSDGRLVVGSRCLAFNPPGAETAVITCYNLNGDSLWSVYRSYWHYNWVHSLVPMADGNIIAAIGQSGGWIGSGYLLQIDANGIVTMEIELPSRARAFVPLSPDTFLVSESETGTGNLVLRKITTDNTTVFERTYGFAGGNTLFLTPRNHIRSRDTYNKIIEFDENLDTLWSFQLPDSFAGIAELSDDGGMILARTNYSQNEGYFTRILKMSAASLQLVPSNSILNFGQAVVGDTFSTTITLRNVGDDNVLVESLSVPESFNASPNAPFWVDVNTLHEIEVSFVPLSPGDFSGNLVIETDTRFEPIEIALIGSALPSEAWETPRVNDFAFSSAFPNPFNPTTTLSFALPRESDVNLSVFDIQGRLVSEVVRGKFTAGQHAVSWSCPECASGIYFATLNAGTYSASQKLLLLK